MKLRLSILLLAAALAASTAAGQTIKSLGYNTTNGQVVYSGASILRMPDQVKFGTNSAGIVSGGQFLTLLDGGGGVALQVGTNRIIAYDAIDFGGVSGTALSNAATTRTNLGLGETNTVTFSNIQLGLFGTASATGFVGRSSGGQFALYGTNVSSSVPALYGWDGFNNAAMSAGTSRTNLGLPGTWLTNTDVTNFRTAIGLGATNNVTFSNLTLNGTLGVSNAATFATNVTVNGNLSVGSLTTTTPSTWALDATQTAAATNGVLTLPSNANVIRLTNNTAISGVSGGVLGAFYYVVNQTTNAVTISNVGGITIDGAQNLTLSPNESATLVATGPTNASVANRGDLNNVTLTGVDNLATQQTASSGSSLMTRSLSDVRYLGEMWNAAQMVPYNTTNIPLSVFRLAPMVTYTNGQAQGPYMEEFVSAQKYAGKTVRVLAYCRADSTNGGNVQGTFNIKYLTNTAGGPDANFALTAGGQAHGTLGVYTNAGTDVFPVATSTNQYLIFTSNVGTIPTNAQMIIVSGGFNRASTNTTYTNNLYMHAVQLVVVTP